MYTKEIEIVNATGLHARPASQFVAKAGSFRSRIQIRRVGDEKWYNAKAIVMLMTLGLAQGERAEISAQGEDEQEAVEALAALVADLKE